MNLPILDLYIILHNTIFLQNPHIWVITVYFAFLKPFIVQSSLYYHPRRAISSPSAPPGVYSCLINYFVLLILLLEYPCWQEAIIPQQRPIDIYL